MKTPLRLQSLTPKLWDALEDLFGPGGACGGCWCMFWRQPRGEPWSEVRGEEARRRLRVLVESGEARGVLAFAGDLPIGWCAVGHKSEFPRLERSPSLGDREGAQAHAIPCFYVRKGWRRQGVARALLRAGIGLLAGEGAQAIEGYPLVPRSDGDPHPAAMAWTGTLGMFLDAGFSHVVHRPAGKQRVVLHVVQEQRRRASG